MSFSPTQISGLEAWYASDTEVFHDSGGTTAASTNGATIALWKDQSGNGNNLPADTGSPTLTVPGLNSLPTIHCDSSSFRLNALHAEVAVPFTIFWVGRKTDTSGGPYMFSTYSTTGSFWGVLFDNGGVPRTRYLAGYGGDGTVYPLDGSWTNPTDWFVGALVFDGPNTRYYRDGLLVHKLNPGTPTGFSGLSVNNSITGFANAGTADYAEIMLFHGDASTDPLWLDLWKYASERWGLPTAPIVASGGVNVSNFFPTLFVLDNREMVCTFSNGTSQLATDNAVYAAASVDGGITWGAPTAVLSDDTLSCLASNSGCVLSNGDILLCYVKQDSLNSIRDSGTIVSTNGGTSWSSPRSMGTFTHYGFVQPYGRPFEVTPGGTLITTAWGNNSVSLHTDSLLLQSTDGGLTWTLRAVIAAGDGTHDYNEAAVCPVDSNNYLAFVRDDRMASGIWKVSSSDGGATWGTPTLFDPSGDGDSPLVSPDLMKLADDSLVLSVTQRLGSPGIGIRQFTSTDGGSTFGDSFYVYQSDFGGGAKDFGYPSAVQRDDGVVVTAWYDDNQAIRASTIFTGETLIDTGPKPLAVSTNYTDWQNVLMSVIFSGDMNRGGVFIYDWLRWGLLTQEDANTLRDRYMTYKPTAMANLNSEL